MTIQVEAVIRASPDVCFDAHRDLGLHVQSAARTGERVLGNRREGLLELGEEVTFEARHFGVRFRLTSKITEFDRPNQFVDEMTRGPFRRLRHVHSFEAVPDGTRVIDEMEFQSPLGPLGWLADRLFVARHLKRFLISRNEWLRGELEHTSLP